MVCKCEICKRDRELLGDPEIRQWEIKQAKGGAELNDALEQGWEPYSVTVDNSLHPPVLGYRHWLKRLKEPK